MQRRGFGSLPRQIEPVFGNLNGGRVFVWVPKPQVGQLPGKASHWILLQLGRNAFFGHISGWVVSGRVGSESIGLGLDQGGAAPGGRTGSSVGDRSPHRQWIATVNPDAGHAKCGSFVGKRFGRGLKMKRRGDGPPVVDQDEDDRRFPHPGQVGRLIKVSFGAGAITKEGEGDARFAFDLHSPCHTHGVRDLARQADLKREDMGIAIVAARGVAHVVQRNAVHDVRIKSAQCRLFPILRKYPVGGGVKGTGRTRSNRFGTIGGGHCSGSALSLQVEEAG